MLSNICVSDCVWFRSIETVDRVCNTVDIYTVS